MRFRQALAFVVLCSLVFQISYVKAQVSPIGMPPEAIEKLKQVNIKANKAAAKHLKVSLDAILACRKAGFDLSFTMVLAVIADEASVEIRDAIETRQSGHVWGEMCVAWDVSPKKVQERVLTALEKMEEEKVIFPPPTLEEWRRAVNNGRWGGPLRGKP